MNGKRSTSRPKLNRPADQANKLVSFFFLHHLSEIVTLMFEQTNIFRLIRSVFEIIIEKLINWQHDLTEMASFSRFVVNSEEIEIRHFCRE